MLYFLKSIRAIAVVTMWRGLINAALTKQCCNPDSSRDSVQGIHMIGVVFRCLFNDSFSRVLRHAGSQSAYSRVRLRDRVHDIGAEVLLKIHIMFNKELTN